MTDNKPQCEINVERVFSENGITLEEIYINYISEKIADLIKDILKESAKS